MMERMTRSITMSLILLVKYSEHATLLEKRIMAQKFYISKVVQYVEPDPVAAQFMNQSL